MSDADKLKSLGSTTQYKFDKPAPEVLESFDNQHPENLYLVPLVQDYQEFTSVCPKTSQPDFARMEIIYVPDKKLVESKSLKLYLFSYRTHGEFHEDVCNKIADDLFELLNPLYLRVYGDFTPRGGIAIKPLIERHAKIMKLETDHRINKLVTAWDIKSKK